MFDNRAKDIEGDRSQSLLTGGQLAYQQTFKKIR